MILVQFCDWKITLHQMIKPKFPTPKHQPMQYKKKQRYGVTIPFFSSSTIGILSIITDRNLIHLLNNCLLLFQTTYVIPPGVLQF